MAPNAPAAAASAGVAIHAKTVPRTSIINPKRGTKETSTSFKISALGGISAASGLGAIDGFIQALITTQAIYKLASKSPGKIAAANNLKGDNCAITE